ncbi:MAG: hypothetical protein EZS28_008947 [Streblomastix strix]|uniref:ATPase AAA-type core domain-containing protein n=1 Tax=Streblomastix strix TaxID=222440 RepID=A0A5J4WLM1_9EUKA|nr:MAG: hypothetical protein EZS28_008947 [Streblomastix strix]
MLRRLLSERQYFEPISEYIIESVRQEQLEEEQKLDKRIKKGLFEIRKNFIERLNEKLRIDIDKQISFGLQKEKIQWDDIIGRNIVKDLLKRDLECMRHRNMHFWGPPGNGKKMMSKAYATKGDLLYIIISLQMIEGEQDEDYIKNISKSFEQANILGSSVLIINQIDEIIKDQDLNRTNMIINELDQQLSDIDNDQRKATVIITSNAFDGLPEQLMKHFLDHQHFDLPSLNERHQFFQRFFQEKNVPVQQSDIDIIASSTERMSFFDLASFGKSISNEQNITVENILKKIQIFNQNIKPNEDEK